MNHRNNQNDRGLERALARWEASTTNVPQTPTGSTLQHVLAAGMPSMFSNAHNAQITGGSFNITTNISTVAGLSLKLLHDRVALNAILNAGGRADEVRCHPGTREEVVSRIEKWGDTPTAHIFWLSGPPGAGKSAIMQTIAERCDERGVPHANFFFFRADSSRSTVSPLVATLLHQVILIYPSLRDPIATALDANPLLLDSPLENQLKQLVVAPLHSIQQSSSPYRRLMLLIDGLDECDSGSKRNQQQILHAFDKVLSQHPSLFCLLVASRDEPQIQAAFHRVSSSYVRLYLDDQYSPESDIRVFVIAQFEEIRQIHPLSYTFDTTWPPLDDVNYIVEKSSGLFIFAATVMRFILESAASPTLSLERVKGAALLASRLPFSHLDAILYILSQVDVQDGLKDILHAEVLQQTPMADEPHRDQSDHPGSAVKIEDKFYVTERPSNPEAFSSHQVISQAIAPNSRGILDNVKGATNANIMDSIDDIVAKFTSVTPFTNNSQSPIFISNSDANHDSINNIRDPDSRRMRPLLTEKIDKADFININDFLARDENAMLSHFFENNPRYIQDLAKKATELANDSSTPLGQSDLLSKVIKGTFYQQVIYCDDSSSMKREGRWAAQVELAVRIAQITTRVLPDGNGVALRFINQNLDNSDKLSLRAMTIILENLSWQPGGDTPIGTNLKSKILEPLIYSQLERKTLAKPYLISVLTDGMPSRENKDTFVEAIKECGVKLQAAGYPRTSVRFLIGQIGTAKSTAKFLESIRDNSDIEDMVYVSADQLDETLNAFKERNTDVDRWLLDMLYNAITK